MQKISLVLLAAAAVAFVGTVRADPELEEGVLVLTDDNFDTELAKHEYLLVEFYAPWCGHCKSLAPEYAKAAQALAKNDPPYYLAKVDATVHKNLAERFSVQGFPTLFFFKKGEKSEYGGGRTESEIVNWILKRVGPASSDVTCEQLAQKAENSKLVAAFFGDSSSDAYTNAWLKAAENPSVEKFQFFHINDAACATSHGASSTPAVILFRKFDTSPVVYSGSLNAEGIVSWLQGSSVPTLIEFSEEYIEPIFGNRKPAVFLFRGPSDTDSSFAKTFAEAASTLKGEILFVVSGVTDGIQGRLAEFIGVDESNLPTIRVLDPNDNMKKFTFPHDTKTLTVADLKTFISDFKAGNLKPFLKSQEIPEDNSSPIRTVVGKNFKEVVLDSDSDVFIKFYAPWCGHCKKMAPAWEELAAEFKDVPNLIIADFDATLNEADGVDIKGFPTLKFYPRGGKSAPLDYDGERELENFRTYIKEHSQAYKAHSGSRTEEL